MIILREAETKKTYNILFRCKIFNVPYLIFIICTVFSHKLLASTPLYFCLVVYAYIDRKRMNSFGSMNQAV